MYRSFSIFSIVVLFGVGLPAQDNQLKLQVMDAGHVELMADSDLPKPIKIIPWVKGDLYMTLADELMMLDPKDGVPEFTWLKPFLKPEFQRDATIENKYAQFQKLISGVDDLRRLDYAETYFETTIRSLYHHANQVFPWSFAFNWDIRHDDNVTQSPDDQAGASDSSGVSYSPSLDLQYQFKKVDHRQWVVGLQTGVTEYGDSQFKTRETRNVGLKASLELSDIPWDKLQSVKPELRYRTDWLNNGTNTEVGFETISLSVQMMMKPWQKLHKYSDVAVLLGVLSYDNRDYKNFLESGTRGDKRDSQIPSLTLLGINLVNHKAYEHRSTLMLYLSTSNSDDPNQDYFSSRFSLQHQMKRKKWAFGPEFIYTYRDQSDYDSNPRRDNGYEFKLKGQYQWKPQLSLGLVSGYKSQDSTQVNFDYDNTYVAFEGQWSLNFANTSPYLPNNK